MEFQDLLALARAGDAAAEREIDTRAACGCIEAQRALLEDMVTGDPSYAGLIRAEVLARLIAARGLLDDQRQLGCLLWARAESLRDACAPDEAASLATEALELLGLSADLGDGKANDVIAIAAARFPAIWEQVSAPRAPAAPVALPEPDAPRWQRFKWWMTDIGWGFRSIGSAVADIWNTVRRGF